MAEKYVNSEYLHDMARLLNSVKEQTYTWMRIEPGQRLLDLGCGPGVDTVPLAKLVGPTGYVTGIDMDGDMLQKADQYALQEQVQQCITHQQADATALPFPDGYFDACRAERLFQVLPTALCEPVLAEMLRVTKSGGWIVAADTDWATVSVDFPDVAHERKLMRFFGESVRPNGYSGRQFWRLMKHCGLGTMSCQAFPMLMRTFQQTPFGDWLREEALTAKIATTEEMDTWRGILAARDAASEFYATVNITIVAGQKP